MPMYIDFARPSLKNMEEEKQGNMEEGGSPCCSNTRNSFKNLKIIWISRRKSNMEKEKQYGKGKAIWKKKSKAIWKREGLSVAADHLQEILKNPFHFQQILLKTIEYPKSPNLGMLHDKKIRKKYSGGKAKQYGRGRVSVSLRTICKKSLKIPFISNKSF